MGGRVVLFLTYTGGVVNGKAEGRGTIRFEAQKWTLRDAEFRGDRLLPSRAVLAPDNGDAFHCDFAAGGMPANDARSAVVLAAGGGRFQGVWPAHCGDNNWFQPLRGAALDRGGRLHRVALNGRTVIRSGYPGWRPGGEGWAAWAAVGTLTAHEVRPPGPPAAPTTRACYSLNHQL
jgi:hypothetical protein